MKCLFVISIVVSTVAVIASHPAGDIVEVEKQRLIKFPEESFQYQTSKQSNETRRILEEINKININLGYVKKKPIISPLAAAAAATAPLTPTLKMPTILDSDKYLYPRPAYHPELHGIAFPPSIRNLRYNNRAPDSTLPGIYSPAYKYTQAQNNIELATKNYLKVPLIQPPKRFRENLDNEFAIQVPDNYKIQIQDSVQPQKLNNMYKIHLVGDLRQFLKSFQTMQNKINTINGKPPIPLIFLPTKLQNYDHFGSSVDDVEARKNNNNDRQRVNAKIKDIKNAQIKKIIPSTTNSLSAFAEAETRFKQPFSIFNKQPGLFAATTQKSIISTSTQSQNANPTSFKQDDTFYDSAEESFENTDDVNEEKTLLSAFNKDRPETIKHGVKDGGIIIQRLKVRKGGIAIAGPGGVATAGSGGTAIVGPGGYALTHPRSLTIAGPGAKIIAYPETINLRELALQTSVDHLPEGGKLVATGPTVYYNPAESELTL